MYMSDALSDGTAAQWNTKHDIPLAVMSGRALLDLGNIVLDNCARTRLGQTRFGFSLLFSSLLFQRFCEVGAPHVD